MQLQEKFDKTEFVEEELVDKITLWMLRIIIKLGGSKEFLDGDNRFCKDSVACFLDLCEYVAMDRDEIKRSEVFAILTKCELGGEYEGKKVGSISIQT